MILRQPRVIFRGLAVIREAMAVALSQFTELMLDFRKSYSDHLDDCEQFGAGRGGHGGNRHAGFHNAVALFVQRLDYAAAFCGGDLFLEFYEGQRGDACGLADY